MDSTLPGLFSYIDPVSGTVLLQLLIAGVIGCIAFCRQWIWKSLRIVLRTKGSRADSEEPT